MAIIDIGAYEYGAPIVGVEENFVVTPTNYRLDQNYPNPFNPMTVLNYSIPQSERVTLAVYNILGQRVATLFEGVQQAGEHTVSWNAANFSSGVYFARLETGRYSKTIKMVLVR